MATAKGQSWQARRATSSRPKPEKTGKIETTDTKILAFVGRCDNAGELESLIKNATKLGNATVAGSSFRKRISSSRTPAPALSSTTSGRRYTPSNMRSRRTAQEHALTRTAPEGRQGRGLYRRARLVCRQPGDRRIPDAARARMPEFTGEAITLRHPEHFEAQTLEARASG